MEKAAYMKSDVTLSKQKVSIPAATHREENEIPISPASYFCQCEFTQKHVSSET